MGRQEIPPGATSSSRSSSGRWVSTSPSRCSTRSRTGIDGTLPFLTLFQIGFLYTGPAVDRAAVRRRLGGAGYADARLKPSSTTIHERLYISSFFQGVSHGDLAAQLHLTRRPQAAWRWPPPACASARPARGPAVTPQDAPPLGAPGTRSSILRLSSNENSAGPGAKVLTAMQDSLASRTATRSGSRRTSPTPSPPRLACSRRR